MRALLILAVVLGVGFALMAVLRGSGRGGDGPRFARKTPFLRKDEIRLYERLMLALKDAHVFPQVAMSAFVTHQGSRSARNAFSQKYVDYLVCDRKTMRPLYVIELDGGSHNSASARKRDRQKDEVLALAGIPIRRYATHEVDLPRLERDYQLIVSSAAASAATAAARAELDDDVTIGEAA
jgi:hypothetical protein